jgi:microcystin-dependent protein
MGEIKIVAFNYAPKGWAQCNGQFLPINQNQALFSILGTTYGGNGQTTFALPDFRGRIPIHTGNGFTLGQAGGEETHTVIMGEMPAHNHFVNANNNPGTLNDPQNNFLANSNVSPYRTVASTTMNPGEITNVGGSQTHENRQPYTALLFCIALLGIFPSRN